MKYITKPWALLLVLLSLLAFTAPASAQLVLQRTFWNFNATNNPGTVTNLAAAIDVSQSSDFALQVVCNTTNPAAGSIDIVWDTSCDGVYYGGATNAALGRTAGWFSVPITNNNVRNVWVTNITVDSVGYWRIRAITNATVQHITNITVRGYIKPARSRADY